MPGLPPIEPALRYCGRRFGPPAWMEKPSGGRAQALSRVPSLLGLLGSDFPDLRLPSLHRHFLCCLFPCRLLHLLFHLLLGRLLCGLACLLFLLWSNGFLIRMLRGGRRPVVIRNVK